MNIKQIVETVSGLYRNILQWLCRRELKKIGDKYPNTIDELIKWHDFMAMECINAETKGRERMLGICIGTSNALDNKQTKQKAKKRCNCQANVASQN